MQVGTIPDASSRGLSMNTAVKELGPIEIGPRACRSYR